MKFTWKQKFVLAFSHFLWIWGATMLCLFVLVLGGVKADFLVGLLCVIPGTLIVNGMLSFLENEREEMRERIVREIAEMEVEKEACRFNKDGQCTYGEGGQECVYPEGKMIQSCEDPNTVYIQEGNIRRILHEGKEVGWYRWE